jgi:hypothetical protein
MTGIGLGSGFISWVFWFWVGSWTGDFLLQWS